MTLSNTVLIVIFRFPLFCQYKYIELYHTTACKERIERILAFDDIIGVIV